MLADKPWGIGYDVTNGLLCAYSDLPRLVVHPVSSCGEGHGGDAGRACRLSAFALPPDEGMAMGIPVLRGGRYRLTHLLPGREPSSLAGEGAQHFPPVHQGSMRFR